MNTTLYVRDFKGNHPRFISYLLKTIHYDKYVDKAAVPGINRNHLHLEPIALPPLREQQQIAALLGALDDKIELNRAMNQTLEEMAQAIFKSWFIDFDGHTDLVSSELGSIPRGWQCKRLDEITSYLRRGFQPTYIKSEGVIVVNQRCIRDGRVTLAKARRHDSRKKSIQGRELHTLDILVNSTGVGTLGRVAIVADFGRPMIVDSHVTVVRANASIITPHVLGMAMKLRQGEIEALGEGSTGQTELSRKRLAALRFLVPPPNAQDDFVAHVSPLLSRIHHNHNESHTLAELRDTLLPKLIAGELRLPEAEKNAAVVL